MNANPCHGMRSEVAEEGEAQLQVKNEIEKRIAVVHADMPASVANRKATENGDVVASTTGEAQTDKNVVKHITVESYVKMIVCRKITVKFIDSSTGKVLHTSCTTEEDDPVVLQVHCAERSEASDTEAYKPHRNSVPSVAEGCPQEIKPVNGEETRTKRSVGRPRSVKSKFTAVKTENNMSLLKGEVNSDLKSSTASADMEGCLAAEGEPATETGCPDNISETRDEASAAAEPSRDLKRSIRATSSLIKRETSMKLVRRSIITTRKQAAVAAGRVPPAALALHNHSVASSMQTPVKRGRGRPPKKPRLTESHSETKEPEGENKELPREQGAVQDKEEQEEKAGDNDSDDGVDDGDDDEDWDGEKERTQKQDKMRRMTGHSCGNCKKRFSTMATYLKHIKRKNCEATFYCKMCTKIFSSQDQLDRHTEGHRDQAENGNYHCRDCNRRYATRGGYMKHKRQGTCFKRDDFEDGVKGEFECELCKTHFRTESFLRLHKYKVHENPDNVFECQQCGRKFYSRQGFLKHEAAKSCTTPFTCPVCGKTYSNKARESFKLHMKHHRAEADGIQFQCEECGRTYLTEEALKKHRIKHTGLRPYKCSVCDKTFPMRYMVKDHERTHSGDKPFLCNMCGSSFSNRGHLYRHIRSHEYGTLHKRGRPRKNTLIRLRLPCSAAGNGSEEIVQDGTIRVMEIKTDPTQDQHDLNSSGVMNPTYITVHAAPAQVVLDSQVVQEQTQEVTMTEGQLQHVVMQAEGISDPMVIQVIGDWAGSTAYHQVSEAHHAVSEAHEILQAHRVVPPVSTTTHHVAIGEKIAMQHQPQHHVVVTAAQQEPHAVIAGQPTSY